MKAVKKKRSIFLYSWNGGGLSSIALKKAEIIEEKICMYFKDSVNQKFAYHEHNLKSNT